MVNHYQITIDPLLKDLHIGGLVQELINTSAWNVWKYSSFHMFKVVVYMVYQDKLYRCRPMAE